MGDPHLSLRALVLADERPYVPLERLLERGVDLVLCLGDLTRHDLEALGSVRLPKLGVHGNHDDGGEFTGLGIENVHLRRIEVAGLCFGGFSGSHEYRAEPRYTWRQKKASKLLRKLGPVDVMLAHSPPLGVNDDADDPAHIGLRACASTSSASARRCCCTATPTRRCRSSAGATPRYATCAGTAS